MSLLLGVPIFLYGLGLYLAAFKQDFDSKDYSAWLGYEGLLIGMMGLVISVSSFYPE
ncbi:MAG: hypothetical protein GY804_11735 [Alphaproteobacteria bacterium]|nr:hypothetical protein [Alphaproteobacteria bacterium]